MFPEYEARNELLKSLGFASYKAYLASPLWRSIRSKVLKKARDKCQVCCRAKAVQVHHRAYTRDVLLGENLNIGKIVAVCDECHTLGERGWKFEKTRMSNCSTRMKKISKAESKRKKICFVCRTVPVSIWNTKCEQCRKLEPRFD